MRNTPFCRWGSYRRPIKVCEAGPDVNGEASFDVAILVPPAVFETLTVAAGPVDGTALPICNPGDAGKPGCSIAKPPVISKVPTFALTVKRSRVAGTITVLGVSHTDSLLTVITDRPVHWKGKSNATGQPGTLLYRSWDAPDATGTVKVSVNSALPVGFRGRILVGAYIVTTGLAKGTELPSPCELGVSSPGCLEVLVT